MLTNTYAPAASLAKRHAATSRYTQRLGAPAFQQSIAGITSWMAENATHPDVKAVITAYTIRRGLVSCIDCAADYPTVIQDFALSQDKSDGGTS
jgi:hypothetical protein